MASVQSFSVGSLAVADSTVVTNPSGLTAGDLMILMAMQYRTGVPQNPGGSWTEIANTTVDLECKAWWKIATSGDVSAGSVTVTYSPAGGQVSGAAMLRITDFDTVTPVEQASQARTTNSTTLNPTAITTAKVGDLIIMLAFDQEEDSWTFTTGNASTVNEHFDSATTAGNDMSIAAASITLTSVGASGTLTGTRTNNIDEAVVYAFLVNGAAAASSTPLRALMGVGT